MKKNDQYYWQIDRHGYLPKLSLTQFPADRAMYFTFRNFFFFYYMYEQSYLSIYWTDFHDLYTKWKVFA